jgi:hypothetical protein
MPTAFVVGPGGCEVGVPPGVPVAAGVGDGAGVGVLPGIPGIAEVPA